MMIIYPPDIETKMWASFSIFMTITCIFVATANIYALVVAWKARKEIIDVYKQEEPAQLDNMENIEQISSTIPQ
jgi:LPS O-antigen subunit length determinant protein (WzzB/FepE family)